MKKDVDRIEVLSKPPKRGPKPRIGDIIEVVTRSGRAYAHYTNYNRSHGELIRVFNRKYDERPSNLFEAVSGEPSFITFLPLRECLRLGLTQVVGNVTPCGKNSQFPTFRAGMLNPVTKQVEVWWLWDGEREWRVGTLTSEQMKFPLRSIWGYKALVSAVESDWTAEGKHW